MSVYMNGVYIGNFPGLKDSDLKDLPIEVLHAIATNSVNEPPKPFNPMDNISVDVVPQTQDGRSTVPKWLQYILVAGVVYVIARKL